MTFNTTISNFFNMMQSEELGTGKCYMRLLPALISNHVKDVYTVMSNLTASFTAELYAHQWTYKEYTTLLNFSVVFYLLYSIYNGSMVRTTVIYVEDDDVYDNVLNDIQRRLEQIENAMISKRAVKNINKRHQKMVNTVNELIDVVNANIKKTKNSENIVENPSIMPRRSVRIAEQNERKMSENVLMNNDRKMKRNDNDEYNDEYNDEPKFKRLKVSSLQMQK